MTMDEYRMFMFPIYAFLIPLIAMYTIKVFMETKYYKFIYEFSEKEKLRRASISYILMSIFSIAIMIYGYVVYMNTNVMVLIHYLIWTVTDIVLIKICIKRAIVMRNQFIQIIKEEEKLPKCSICEQILPEDAKICPNCGHDLSFKAKKGNKAYE